MLKLSVGWFDFDESEEHSAAGWAMVFEWRDGCGKRMQKKKYINKYIYIYAYK